MRQRLALIVGGGGVLGGALTRALARDGYAVFSLRRALAANTDATVLACDLSDADKVHDAVASVAREHGAVDLLVHNAAHFVAAPFDELTAADFDLAWQVGFCSAVSAAQAALPGMVARGSGTLLFTGATAALRGSARFAAFASVKFAVRGLAQSLAREYQPRGIHVAHVVLDGLLRGSPSVARFGGTDERSIDPDDAAQAYLGLAKQPRSSWSHELDLRPWSERF
jgi:NAD(P)-dependent dehydrogenase (short-subunit alcohol dehydrogenase family)